MPPNPSANFEIQRYYQNKPRFNGVYSGDNLPKTNFYEKIKDGAYLVDLDKYFDAGTHCPANIRLDEDVFKTP